nr:plasmid mobilization relaxosome protein MobC [Shimia sediminis]
MRERAELERRSHALGLTLSEYIRRRTLGVPLPPQSADRETRDKLATSLLRIGVNLNQITKHMNAGRHAPPELPALVATINTHLKILTRHESR